MLDAVTLTTVDAVVRVSVNAMPIVTSGIFRLSGMDKLKPATECGYRMLQ